MTVIAAWFRKRKLERLKKKLFDLEWSYPPPTYSFNESQIIMHGRDVQMKNIRREIKDLEGMLP
jgi:hypothetical protein